MATWPLVWNGYAAEPSGAPSVSIEFECETKGESNERGFWKATNRKKKQDNAFGEALMGHKLPDGPWCVRFTRLSPMRLDDDNLASAFKRCRDRMAEALGINDRDPVVAWVVAQEKRKGPQGVRVEVWGKGALP